MEKIVKHTFFIFQLLLRSDLEEAEESFEKLKCLFKILDFCLMFFLISLNEILTES